MLIKVQRGRWNRESYLVSTFPWVRGRIRGLRSVAGYLGLAAVFAWDSAVREEFNFYFLLGLAKFSFWQGGCALWYHSIGFGQFPGLS